ncbi:DUF998 domain-containing protein [Mycolicibacterium sp. S2-37]|uniref:DUF998 domain-containing protein n=1 Tax=Mycolicibacterium sp. S2-37 TaxID=2810297 RepID=UPI001A9481F7|nr:DUF998 domain-containing protein [Mycolicibacterium sp. S2-37]MBO0678259.1 DUF998 domain-containing protein [Mycolicibacterium sp. S2-37]
MPAPSSYLPRAAAAAWIVGAVVYLGVEAASAAASGGEYHYAHDVISDLGVPGRPLAALMNVAFGVQGAMFLLGAVLAQRRRTPLLTVFAAANAAGNVLVATVHAGAGPLHVAGAALAIVGGNAAAVAGAGLRPGRTYRLTSRLLGTAGLVSTAALVAQAWTGAQVLPAAVWERAAVYPIFAWQLLAAAVLLLPARGEHAQRP